MRLKVKYALLTIPVFFMHANISIARQKGIKIVLDKIVPPYCGCQRSACTELERAESLKSFLGIMTGSHECPPVSDLFESICGDESRYNIGGKIFDEALVANCENLKTAGIMNLLSECECCSCNRSLRDGHPRVKGIFEERFVEEVDKYYLDKDAQIVFTHIGCANLLSTFIITYRLAAKRFKKLRINFIDSNTYLNVNRGSPRQRDVAIINFSNKYLEGVDRIRACNNRKLNFNKYLFQFVIQRSLERNCRIAEDSVMFKTRINVNEYPEYHQDKLAQFMRWFKYMCPYVSIECFLYKDLSDYVDDFRNGHNKKSDAFVVGHMKSLSEDDGYLEQIIFDSYFDCLSDVGVYGFMVDNRISFLPTRLPSLTFNSPCRQMRCGKDHHELYCYVGRKSLGPCTDLTIDQIYLGGVEEAYERNRLTGETSMSKVVVLRRT